MKKVSVLLALAVILTACGRGAPQTQIAPTNTLAPTPTALTQPMMSCVEAPIINAISPTNALSVNGWYANLTRHACLTQWTANNFREPVVVLNAGNIDIVVTNGMDFTTLIPAGKYLAIAKPDSPFIISPLQEGATMVYIIYGSDVNDAKQGVCAAMRGAYFCDFVTPMAPPPPVTPKM